MYDKTMNHISYIGHVILQKTEPIAAVIQAFLLKAKLPMNTVCKLHEDFNRRSPCNELLDLGLIVNPETDPELSKENYVKPLYTGYQKTLQQQVQHVIEDVTNGDVLIIEPWLPKTRRFWKKLEIQRKVVEGRGEIPDEKLQRKVLINYFHTLETMEIVKIVDKESGDNIEDRNFFTMKVNLKDDFKVFVKKIADSLDMDPKYLQFFMHDSYRDEACQKPLSMDENNYVHHYCILDKSSKGGRHGIRTIYYKKVSFSQIWFLRHTNFTETYYTNNYSAH